jgi:hypothetical protein
VTSVSVAPSFSGVLLAGLIFAAEAFSPFSEAGSFLGNFGSRGIKLITGLTCKSYDWILNIVCSQTIHFYKPLLSDNALYKL